MSEIRELPKVIEDSFWYALAKDESPLTAWFDQGSGIVDGRLPDDMWEYVANQVLKWMYKDFKPRVIE